METPTFGKTSQIWLKDFDTLQTFFQTYPHGGITKVSWKHFLHVDITGQDSHGELTKSENGTFWFEPDYIIL